MSIHYKTGATNFLKKTWWLSVHVLMLAINYLKSYPELIRKFIKFNEGQRWDNNVELSQIAYMDETPLLMNISNTKTIVKVGSKEVNIKAHG